MSYGLAVTRSQKMKLLKIWLENIQLFSITNYTIARNSGYVHEIAPQKKNAPLLM